MDIKYLALLNVAAANVFKTEAVEVATTHNNEKNRAIKPVKDYEADNVSKKILRIILSYTDYINRTVWHKEI